MFRPLSNQGLYYAMLDRFFKILQSKKEGLKPFFVARPMFVRVPAGICPPKNFGDFLGRRQLPQVPALEKQIN